MKIRNDRATYAERFVLPKVLQRVASIPSDLFLQLSSHPAIEEHLLYPRYRAFLQEHEPHLPKLAPQDLAIAQELSATGISVTSLANLNLPDDDNFLTAAESLSTELAQLSKLPAYRRKHTLSANAEQLMRYPEIFWWGAQERLLRIIESYLQLPVAYDGLSYYHSIANELEAGPRKWHRDKEDWRMVKIGIYINDVDAAGGPFECVSPAANLKICESATHKYQIFQDRQLADLLGAGDRTWCKSCVGKKGTVIFVDTAAYYHRGRPPIAVDRSAIFFGYFSLRPKHPFYCGRSPLSQARLARLARPLPEHIQRSVMWRDRLPGIGRWIPKNLLKV